MAAYWTVLLSVLTTDIAGVRSEWQCNDTCCAGAFSLGSKKCEKLRPCSDTGQYIIRAGNETQDNKCWCDEGKRFSPIRPKLCWEKSEACGCLQCPEGTKPDLVDKNGQYVEHFDKDKHCKRMCEPTGNRIGDGIGIGIAISIGVFFVVLFIPWIYYCWRYKKCTFPFKFMTKESHKNELSEAQWEILKLLGPFVLDKKLIRNFENGLLSKEDTEKWIKDAFEKIRTKSQPVQDTGEVPTTTNHLRVSGSAGSQPGPTIPTHSGVSGSPGEQSGPTIPIHSGVSGSPGEQTGSSLGPPTDAVKDSTVPSNSSSGESPSATGPTPDSVHNQTAPSTTGRQAKLRMKRIEADVRGCIADPSPLTQTEPSTTGATGQTAPSITGATRQTGPSTTGATGQTAPSTTGATGQTAPSTTGATGQTGPSTTGATGPGAVGGGDTRDDSKNSK